MRIPAFLRTNGVQRPDGFAARRVSGMQGCPTRTAVLARNLMAENGDGVTERNLARPC